MKREKPYYTETYAVLTADSRVRHGPYAKNGLLNRALVRGYFREGRKDSIWSFYYAPSGQLQSRGRYQVGQKAGRWEYWGPDGKLRCRYNHSTRTLENLVTPADTTTWVVELAGQRRRQRLTSPVLFVGGDEIRWLGADGRIRYPDSALKRQAAGRVMVEFIVDENGNARDFRVVESLDTALDAEALRVTRQVFDNWWLPVTIDAKPTKVVFTQPITFTIQ
ncbi:TonB family protein [Hymenobacter koreensis]|uniref:TonB family protein n=1 Tax=Hymenobacter koreensis TaxID=1084523 RepID=UPI0031EA429D